jgi:hypothetical protein
MTITELMHILITDLAISYEGKPVDVQSIKLSWEDRAKSCSEKVLIGITHAKLNYSASVFGKKQKYNSYTFLLMCETDESISVYKNEEIIKDIMDKIQKIEYNNIEDISAIGGVSFVPASDQTNKTSSVYAFYVDTVEL